MGFCPFDDPAIAARYAQKARAPSASTIMDFDVHHGNGTQDIFWDDKTVMYGSAHEMPLYPAPARIGERRRVGHRRRAVAVGDGGETFREALEPGNPAAPRASAPDLADLSPGFDARGRDPLANLNLVEPDFAWVTGELMEIAEARHARARHVGLEGGYDSGAVALGRRPRDRADGGVTLTGVGPAKCQRISRSLWNPEKIAFCNT